MLKHDAILNAKVYCSLVAFGFQQNMAMAKTNETVWHGLTFLASLFLLTQVVFFHLSHHFQLIHLHCDVEVHYQSLERNEKHSLLVYQLWPHCLHLVGL